MEIDLAAFHFIRPAWLWLLISAFALPFFWFRRTDVRHRWRNIIDPSLLEHLIVGETRRVRIRPAHTLGLLIAIGAVSLAGPTWQTERPPFSQDQAPLVVVLELAHSMDATDIAPSRLARAKQKVLTLAHARQGARTGLVVFASTAHLVVPPSDDPAMLELYVPALSPSLMPSDGKNAADGLREAERLLDADPVAGTIVFISDGFDVDRTGAFVSAAKGIRHQLLWLAVGSMDGAPIRAEDGTIQMDASGQPLRGTFDVEAIRTVAHEAGIPLASLRADDDDIDWVRRRAQAYLAEVEQSHVAPRWKESGYWLVFPLLLLGLWSFRKGWTVKWLPGVLLWACLASTPQPVRADSGPDANVSVNTNANANANANANVNADAEAFHWIDWFATHDQQGRWYFEHNDFTTAAQRFDDPMWKGRAQYLAGDYAGALESFSRLKTAQSYFYIGNTLAHLDDYKGATKAYENALKIDPHLKQAKRNIHLMRHLIAEDKKAEYDPENEQPDQVVQDKRKGQGTKVVSEGAPRPTEDVWLRNLNTSPATFLKQRFAQESDVK